MARLLLVLVIIVVAFTIYALVDSLMLERSRIRGLPRWAWVLIVLLLPPIGGVLWFLIGRGAKRGAAPRPRVLGPDDDPDFLGTMRAPTRSPVDDERLRELEQQLSDMDDEQDNGRKER
ncbi:PLD nuclease N-terminal domain-containing protein [Cnuibacter sp. UC19_7]|uniref:PLD nuclease N-terminal domain-containing protein n=1 Tax=Cnuibacter sp. UC19_7 TaxID=3350166 RepID=UPI00366DBDD3